MSDYYIYEEAVQTIKSAILQSQFASVKAVNENQLVLYFYVGKYISLNTRSKSWGQGAIEAIARQLEKEMPGLRGFSARNLRYMRSFYEEWSMLDAGNNFALPSAKIAEEKDTQILHLQVQNSDDLSIGSHWRIECSNDRSGQQQQPSTKRRTAQHACIVQIKVS